MRLIHWTLQTYQKELNHKWQLEGVGHSTSVRTEILDLSEEDQCIASGTDTEELEDFENRRSHPFISSYEEKSS